MCSWAGDGFVNADEWRELVAWHFSRPFQMRTAPGEESRVC